VKNQNAGADSDRTKSFVELEKKTRESAKNRWMNTLGL
jgi:hypothetical protein